MTKWTWRANTLTKKSLRWQQPRPPSTPTPAHVSGRNGATGDCAVPPAEEEFPPGTEEFEKEAVNGGEQCEGSTEDEEHCHQEPCRKLTSVTIPIARNCSFSPFND